VTIRTILNRLLAACPIVTRVSVAGAALWTLGAAATTTVWVALADAA
jgi:hypothetical protein